MLNKFHVSFLASAFIFFAAAAQADVFNMGTGLTSLQFVSVGDPGNAADPATGNLYGAVSYSYDIGKFDVTAAQYTAFLNAVATANDPYGLYNPNMDTAASQYGCNIKRTLAGSVYSYSVATEWANRPVNYVSWGDATRFCNWLQNSQKVGIEGLTTTEDGAYFLNGKTSDADLLGVTRKTGAAYFLPTEDEWYKAAYYDPNKPGGAGYWSYPTKSNTPPSNVLSATNTNSANYNINGNYTLNSPYYRTDVGAFANSPSAYGTFDQGGNVNQWNETKVTIGPNSYRGLRGGAYNSTEASLASSGRNFTSPTGESPLYGFRVASLLQMEVFSWKGGNDDTKTAWGVAANWSPLASVPDGPGVKVQFGSQPASSSIVDMISVGRTVGSISFAAATSTLIQSTYGYSLTLDNRGNLSTIDVEGDHYISAPVILGNDAKLSGSGHLTLWGGISGNHTLTVTGSLSALSIQVDKLVIGSPVTAQAVPEPSVLGLLLAYGLGLAAFVWKRRKDIALG
jgi:formylglycine-generating enzyme required for sulfatase activity